MSSQSKLLRELSKLPPTVEQCICQVHQPIFECPYYGRKRVDFSKHIEKFMVR